MPLLGRDGGYTLTRKTTGAKKAPAKSKTGSKPAAKKLSTKKPVSRKAALKKAANQPLYAADRALLERKSWTKLAHISSIAFAGPELDSACFGVLLADRLPMIPMPARGVPPVHWEWR